MSEIEGEDNKKYKPYENTGIEEGDRIIKINDTQIDSTDELIETVNMSKGEEIKLELFSGGKCRSEIVYTLDGYKEELAGNCDIFDLSDLENPEFSFSWYHEFSDKEHSRMEVLVAYDSGDFELLETISTNTTTSDWVRWRRILDQDVKQVRIRTIKEDWYGQKPIFIDHILLQEGPSCPYPYDLEARLLPGEDGTALLQWTASEQANAWRIKVSSQSIDPATEEADVLTAEVQDSTRYQVSGLQVGESYFWYVQTLCGESGSDWIAGDTLEVDPAPLQVPFLLDFEESDEGFQRIQENQVNAWYWGSQAYGGDTNRCFFVSDDGGESYHLSSSQGSRSHLWRDIVFPADAPQGFELSFDFKGNGSTYNQVMEVSIVEDLDYLPSAGNFIDHFNVSYTLDEYLHFSPEWSHRSYEIPASFAGKDVRLVITWRNSDTPEMPLP